MACLKNQRKDPVKVVFKKVLKQARGDSRPEVRVGVSRPFAREAPNFLRVPLDMIGNANDRLPALIQLTFMGLPAWKDSLRFPYSEGDVHVFSQRLFR